MKFEYPLVVRGEENRMEAGRRHALTRPRSTQSPFPAYPPHPSHPHPHPLWSGVSHAVRVKGPIRTLPSPHVVVLSSTVPRRAASQRRGPERTGPVSHADESGSTRALRPTCPLAARSPAAVADPSGRTSPDTGRWCKNRFIPSESRRHFRSRRITDCLTGPFTRH